MKQCLIYDSSLRFSRAVYGLMTLIAFFLHSQWLLFAAAALVTLGAFSLKLNLAYQLHALFTKKPPVQKESGELRFVAATTGFLLFFGWLLIYFDKFVNFGWYFILVVALLIFLACFVGFCVATMMYILLKKIFNKNKIA